MRTMIEQLDYEKGALARFRRTLRTEDQRVFDEVWVYVPRHLRAANLSEE